MRIFSRTAVKISAFVPPARLDTGRMSPESRQLGQNKQRISQKFLECCHVDHLGRKYSQHAVVSSSSGAKTAPHRRFILVQLREPVDHPREVGSLGLETTTITKMPNHRGQESALIHGSYFKGNFPHSSGCTACNGYLANINVSSPWDSGKPTATNNQSTSVASGLASLHRTPKTSVSSRFLRHAEAPDCYFCPDLVFATSPVPSLNDAVSLPSSSTTSTTCAIFFSSPTVDRPIIAFMNWPIALGSPGNTGFQA